MQKLKRKKYGTSDIKLLNGAIKVFGKYGFEGATTRKIASTAGTNLAVINYYYTDKKGLYLAVIKHIMDDFRGQIGDTLDITIDFVKNPDFSKEMAEKVLDNFLEKTITVVSGDKSPTEFSKIINRELIDPTSAFNEIYNEFFGPIHKALTIIISKLTDMNSDSKEAIIATNAMMTQLMGLHNSKELLFKRLDTKKFNQADIKLIKEITIFHIKAIIQTYQRGNTHG